MVINRSLSLLHKLSQEIRAASHSKVANTQYVDYLLNEFKKNQVCTIPKCSQDCQKLENLKKPLFGRKTLKMALFWKKRCLKHRKPRKWTFPPSFTK